MEQSEESRQGSMPIAHEYPDPDHAAYLTRYPWLGGEANLIRLEAPDHQDKPWRRVSQESPRSDVSAVIDSHTGEVFKNITGFLEADGLDPDYQISDDAVSQVLPNDLIRLTYSDIVIERTVLFQEKTR